MRARRGARVGAVVVVTVVAAALAAADAFTATDAGAAKNPTCTLDTSDTLKYPFLYRSPNGSIITQGSLVEVSGGVPGFGDTPSQVCVFNTSACGLTHPRFANGSSFRCCEETPELADAADVFLYPLIGFWGPYIVLVVMFRRYARRKAERMIADAKEAARREGRDALAAAALAKQQFEKEAKENNAMANMMEQYTTCQKYFMGTLFFAGITGIVVESVVMPKSIQTTLSPPDRSAQLAMSSFLTPIAEVFRFLEDGMIVEVGYAISAGAYDELNALMHIGVFGGALSATVAFAVAGVLAAGTGTASAILNPSAASNQILIDSGCDLIPTTSQLLSHARPYWLLVSASWLPKFASLSVFGFFAATGQLAVQLISLTTQAVVPITVWFVLLGATNIQPLTILGLAYGLQDWLLAIVFIGYFIIQKDLRRKFRLQFDPKRMCCCGSSRSKSGARLLPAGGGAEHSTGASTGDSESDSGTWWRVLRRLAKDGLRIMVVDLAVQASLTVTIYIAASQHMEAAYKLAAATSAYWTFGPQYLTGTMLIFKIVGARMIASGRHKGFVGFFTFVSVMTLTLAASAVFAAVLRGSWVAFDFGESACVFASDERCARTYAAIFGGNDGLDRVFEAFGPTVGLQLLFVLFRGGLAMCHDFGFMMKGAVGSLVVAYIPSIIIAAAVLKTATAYYVAMYMPHFLMVCVFGWRMVRHLRALARGGRGPWTKHMRRASGVDEDDAAYDEALMRGERVDSGGDDRDRRASDALLPTSDVGGDMGFTHA